MICIKGLKGIFDLVIMKKSRKKFAVNDFCPIFATAFGGIAQLVEHLLCKQGVKSSNLFISTKKDNRKVVLFSFLPLSLFATLGFFGYLCTF